MADEPLVSPFSRPPAPPKTFTRPVTSSPIATPQPITAPKPAGPVEIVENLPMGFMAGLVAAAVGAGLWALVTIVTGFQIGWMAVGVGFLVGWAVRVAGKGTHRAFGIMGALRTLLPAVVAPFAATLADRYRRERVLSLSVAARALMMAGMAVAASASAPIGVLYGLAAVTACISTATNSPSYSSRSRAPKAAHSASSTTDTVQLRLRSREVDSPRSPLVESATLEVRWWTCPAMVVRPGPPSRDAAAALNPPMVANTPVPADVSVK